MYTDLVHKEEAARNEYSTSWRGPRDQILDKPRPGARSSSSSSKPLNSSALTPISEPEREAVGGNETSETESNFVPPVQTREGDQTAQNMQLPAPEPVGLFVGVFTPQTQEENSGHTLNLPSTLDQKSDLSDDTVHTPDEEVPPAWFKQPDFFQQNNC